MQLIDGEQVHKLGDFSLLIAALERFHGEDTDSVEDLMLTQERPLDENNHLLVRAAWQYGRHIGVKLVTVFPDNPNDNETLPSVQAVVVLFDGQSGIPIVFIDGTALTYRKTAADSALGSKFLCRDNVKTMLMVGAGGLAQYLVQAHLTVRPTIDTVLIWNRSSKRATTLAQRVSEIGVHTEIVPDLETAVRGADVVCCATSSPEPLIFGSWLQPGAHLDLVGAYTSSLREADDEVFRRGSIFVDARSTTVDVLGELTIPIDNGVISAADVLADLFELARYQHPGRRNSHEITVFKNGGGGHLDLMTARFLLERSQQ